MKSIRTAKYQTATDHQEGRIQVTYLPIARLELNPRNPRIHGVATENQIRDDERRQV